MKRLFAAGVAVILLGAGCGSVWPGTPKGESPQPSPEAGAPSAQPIKDSATTTGASPEAEKPVPVKPAAKKPTPQPAPAYVTITDIGFMPNGMTVKAGTKVTWTNTGKGSHSVESENNIIHSGNIAPGKSYSYTYSAVGTYPYFDGSHPEIKGTIYVN